MLESVVLILTFLLAVGFGFLSFKLLTKPTNSVVSEVTDKVRKVKNPEIDVELIKLEFEYAKATSLKSQEDRVTLVNFYLGLFAGIATVSAGLNELLDKDFIKFIGLGLLALGLISYVFILFIIRLRQAWVESVKVMNRLKDYFLDKNPALDDYIIWKSKTVPKAEKFYTLNQLSTLLVGSLGSTAFFSGLYLLEINLLIASFVAIFNLWLSLMLYYFMLKYWK